MKLPLFTAAVYILIMLTSSAQASQLTTWQLSSNGRRLSFKTNGGVQPKALLLFSPTRLIIDLPATTFPRRTTVQKLSGYFSTLRVGQFKGNTTRLVLEMRRGYTLNPRQIRFTGLSPVNWIVDIPNVGKAPNF